MRKYFLLSLVFMITACAGSKAVPPSQYELPVEAWEAAAEQPAVAAQAVQKEEPKQVKFKIETTMGTLEGVLFEDEVPKTVANFKKLVNDGFYDGIIFHRVIPRFMIQTGDPLGNGTGGPGYKFEDEFHPDLRHDKPGMLSMANSGPNTNGSQFFITEVPTPHLDNRHSVFGQVTSGVELIGQIARVPRDGRDKPIEDVVMKKVTIIEG